MVKRVTVFYSRTASSLLAWFFLFFLIYLLVLITTFFGRRKSGMHVLPWRQTLGAKLRGRIQILLRLKKKEKRWEKNTEDRICSTNVECEIPFLFLLSLKVNTHGPLYERGLALLLYQVLGQRHEINFSYYYLSCSKVRCCL